MSSVVDEYATVSEIYESFDPRHYQLFCRTWEQYVAGGQARQLGESQVRALYDANPAGPSAVTRVLRGNDWVGAISGIATEVALPEGGRITAYQIGDFMVDPREQGRGLGGKLLRELTRFLVAMAVPIYTYPNVRSAPIFLRQGYLELRSLPLVAYPLVPAALLGGAAARRLSLDEACELADDVLAAPRRSAMLAKDGKYLRWRYGQMRTASEYAFTAVAGPSRPATLCVSSLFRYRHVPVQVVVDIVDDGQASPPLRELAAGGLRGGGVLGVTNIDPPDREGLPPLTVRIPRRFDPRPARLLVPPDQKASETLFRSCRFATGDWMGF